MSRDELSDPAWARLAPLLPPQRPRTGRPARDHRTIVDALLWLARTGAPWRDLPERYGPWPTMATRFYRWNRSGVWPRVLALLPRALALLQRLANAEGALDWGQHVVDGTRVRADRRAVGAMRGQKRKGLGCARRLRQQAASALRPARVCLHLPGFVHIADVTPGSRERGQYGRSGLAIAYAGSERWWGGRARPGKQAAAGPARDW